MRTRLTSIESLGIDTALNIIQILINEGFELTVEDGKLYGE